MIPGVVSKLFMMWYKMVRAIVLFPLKILRNIVLGEPMLQLGDQVVLVTGCDTGFGYLLTKELDSLGVRVYAGCYSDDGVRRLKNECKHVHALRMDVTSLEDIQRVHDLIVNEKKERVWAVVNNAGIAKGGFMEFAKNQDYRDVFAVNYFGMVDVCKAFIDALKRTKGRIVNVTSVAGVMAAPGMGPYASSKHAAEAFTNGIRGELAKVGVTVIDIAPGFHRTPLVVNSTALIDKMCDENKDKVNDYDEDFAKKSKEGIRKIIANAADPMNVAKAMVHAITAEEPKAKYWLGYDAAVCRFLSILPPHIMPDLF